LLVPPFLLALGGGDLTGAARLAEEMAALARRTGDIDLGAFARLCEGEARLAGGDFAAGIKLFDELMVSVCSGEVSPIPSGVMFCAVIGWCIDTCDLQRAVEWTGALAGWCDAQQGLVPFRGQCLVHRSQVLLAQGSWAQAAVEAERAESRLSEPPHPALGEALYQRGELHRLRGEDADADRLYRAAHAQGRDPTPGIALLRLAQGRTDAAGAAIRRALIERVDGHGRAVLLMAAVEILLAVGDLAGAHDAARELADLAAGVDVEMLTAAADAAAGAVDLAEGRAEDALLALRRAGSHWRSLAMPYEAARVRVLTAQACRALGDDEAADLELDAARATFVRLGASSDIRRVDATRRAQGISAASPLSAREREVLTLVAAGKTDREIAGELVLSEHTVGRHLQNIFVKLGVSSRAAATAHAYEHGLL
jgi:ATP/maltotriose-dependent transcriptional regulator MalT